MQLEDFRNSIVLWLIVQRGNVFPSKALYRGRLDDASMLASEASQTGRSPQENGILGLYIADSIRSVPKLMYGYL